MRVVTTCHKEGLEQYGQRWLDGRKHWPKGTEFHWYTEGYPAPDGVIAKDFGDIPEFIEWKARHLGYIAPSWQWDVVRYAHKVFAAIDALYDYDGLAVWLDADAVTYKRIPPGFIEKQLDGAFLAHFARVGMYTETGMWIMDCAHPEKLNFLDAWRNWYLAERFKLLPQWHDCMTLDMVIRSFHKDNRIKTTNLSGEHIKDMHPMAKSEIGRYIDHCKGPRKIKGYSPENKFRKAA